jgi:hypothetical protein
VIGSRFAAAYITRARRSRCVFLSSSWLLRTSLRYFLDDDISSLTLLVLSGGYMGIPASLLRRASVFEDVLLPFSFVSSSSQ